jgi:DNA repair protein RadC
MLINLSIKCWAEDDRPREKLLTKGAQSLSNAELLAIVLNTGYQNKSALELAKELLAHHANKLSEIARLDFQDFCKVKGIGPAKALSIMAVLELAKRKEREPSLSKTKIKISKEVYDYLKPYLLHLRHEEFYVLYLNRANEIIACKQLSKGGLTGTIVDQRIIFRFAVEFGATNLIFAHNHPSGQLKPSEQDIKITKKLVEIGELMEIHVLDHLIFTDNNYFSFLDEGMINT